MTRSILLGLVKRRVGTFCLLDLMLVAVMLVFVTKYLYQFGLVNLVLSMALGYVTAKFSYHLRRAVIAHYDGRQ